MQRRLYRLEEAISEQGQRPADTLLVYLVRLIKEQAHKTLQQMQALTQKLTSPPSGTAPTRNAAGQEGFQMVRSADILPEYPS